MTTLSDYWREKMIPRGLRIKKFPSFGAEDSEFKEKWEAILNKFSLDLMLLLIQEAKKQKTLNEIANLKEEISTNFKNQQISFEKELEVDLEKLQRELKQEKLRKFNRDLSDYKDNKVYWWKQKRSFKTQLQRRRTVSFQLPSSDEDHSEIEESSSSTFLGTRPQRNNISQRQRSGRQEEVEASHQGSINHSRYTRSKGKMKMNK